MNCPLDNSKLIRLSDDNVYVCSLCRLYFRSRGGVPSPPTGMTVPPESEELPEPARSEFEEFLRDQGIPPENFQMLDGPTKASLKRAFKAYKETGKPTEMSEMIAFYNYLREIGGEKLIAEYERGESKTKEAMQKAWRLRTGRV